MMTNKVNAKMHRLITIAFILYGFNIDGQLGGIPSERSPSFEELWTDVPDVELYRTCLLSSTALLCVTLFSGHPVI
eukprot:GAHX01004391.1.p2 GENE.GAHX01004391.1~~GAHX01004391.1.p2  ORF type:complete len:76 (-),score=8.49 GAHX01004391.1:182-409(-)